MRLSSAISEYIAQQRSLGVQFLAGEKCLKSFLRGMGDIDLDQIDSDAVWRIWRDTSPSRLTGSTDSRC